MRWKTLLDDLDPGYGLWPPELDACERGSKWPWLDHEQVFGIGSGRPTRLEQRALMSQRLCAAVARQHRR
jgi:hypothetical protein